MFYIFLGVQRKEAYKAWFNSELDNMSLDFWTINFIKCVQFEQNISKATICIFTMGCKIKTQQNIIYDRNG